jgi:hypothetical protein
MVSRCHGVNAGRLGAGDIRERQATTRNTERVSSFDRRISQIVAWTTTVAMVVGCSAIRPTTSPPTSTPASTANLPAGGVEIPTASTTPGLDSCIGGFDALPLLLTGSPTERPAVWANLRQSRVSIIWPLGYYATFDSTLLVRNAAGQVVARQGDDMRVLVLPGTAVCVGPGGGIVFTLPVGATPAPTLAPEPTTEWKVDVVSADRPVIISVTTDRAGWAWLVPAGARRVLLDQATTPAGGLVELIGLDCTVYDRATLLHASFTLTVRATPSGPTAYALDVTAGASLGGPADTAYAGGCSG